MNDVYKKTKAYETLNHPKQRLLQKTTPKTEHLVGPELLLESVWTLQNTSDSHKRGKVRARAAKGHETGQDVCSSSLEDDGGRRETRENE